MNDIKTDNLEWAIELAEGRTTMKHEYARKELSALIASVQELTNACGTCEDLKIAKEKLRDEENIRVGMAKRIAELELELKQWKK